MPTISMKDLLTSGVHFGHQTRRWNPKMKPYIFSERGGIYIIDLQKTTVLVDEAYAFLRNVAGRNGVVLFVGTKKQCQESIKEQAERVGMPYVNSRWLGGLLTNFVTLSKRIKRLHELRQLIADGSLDLLPTREQITMRGELQKLETNLGGVADMERLPDAVFVVDPRKESIVVKEANKLHIPIVALVDTNCDPDEIQYVMPGNDDAIRSCLLIVRTVADAVAEGRAKVALEEFKAAERAAAEKAAADKAAAERAAVEKAAAEAAEQASAEAAAAAPQQAPEAVAAQAGRDAAAEKPAAVAEPPARAPAAPTRVSEKPAAGKAAAPTPAVEKPIERPAAAEPPAAKSAAKEPAVEKPIERPAAAKKPAAEKPIEEPAATKPPAAKKPAAEKPIEEPAATKPPAAKKPAADKPVAEESAAKKPAAEKPAAKKPAVKKPAAKKPAAKKPAAKKAAAGTVKTEAAKKKQD